MYINYEIGMDGDGVTREDALKKLNTKLLSGEGPDVIILDGMDSAKRFIIPDSEKIPIKYASGFSVRAFSIISAIAA